MTIREFKTDHIGRRFTRVNTHHLQALNYYTFQHDGHFHLADMVTLYVQSPTMWLSQTIYKLGNILADMIYRSIQIDMIEHV